MSTEARINYFVSLYLGTAFSQFFGFEVSSKQFGEIGRVVNQRIDLRGVYGEDLRSFGSFNGIRLLITIIRWGKHVAIVYNLVAFISCV